MSFRKIFVHSLIAQLVVFLAYVAFGVDWSGGETAFQRIYLWIYRPSLLATWVIQSGLGHTGWGSLRTLILFSPLLGIVVYSVVAAAIIRSIQRWIPPREKSTKNPTAHSRDAHL